jgi:hypothetical protein
VLFAGEWDKVVGRIGHVPYPRSGVGCVEVDDGVGPPVCEDEVVGREVIVADHFVGTGRGLKLPDRAVRGSVPYGRIVVATHEADGVHERLVRPRVERQWIVSEHTRNEGKDLPPTVVKAEEPRGAVEALSLEVPE